MKNNIIIFVGIFVAFGVHADVDYLDAQIAELTLKRDNLKAELESCEKNTHGYKIAGISTLAATGVGIVGNIKLAQEIKKVETSGGARSGGGMGDTGGQGLGHLSQEQKGNLQCQMFCADMPDDAAALGCEC